jgi:hypothetical protein
MSGALISVFANQRAFTAVPGAPTIGTATATGSTTATVAYTAPASNGGSAITSYTATSSPGGITGTLSQAGSGTITVTGLTAATSYTFTVKATNAIGQGPASSASNSITTVPTVGQSFGGGYFAGQISTAGNGVADYNLVVGPVSSAQSGTNLRLKIDGTGTAGTSSYIDGPTNSANMNNASNPAAQYCEGLSVGGYSDWYLPAFNEVGVIYYNLKPTTDGNDTNAGANDNSVPKRTSNYTSGNPARTSASAFQSGGAEAYTTSPNYWSSTQIQNVYGYYGATFRMDVGASANRPKFGTYQVRAIRRVAV